MLNDLTILIPTRDRPYHLNRLLYFLNKKKCKFKIIISDSSVDKFKITKDFFLAFPNLKISLYKNIPEDSFKDFLRKMLKAINKVNSEYIYWLCDDDFVNLEILQNGLKSIMFDKSSTFIGRVKNFKCINVNNVWSEIIQENFQYAKLTNRAKYAFKSKNFSNRFNFLKKIQPYEGITKKKILFEVFNFCIKNDIKNFHDFSLAYKSIILVNGTVKISNKILLLRQSNVPNSEGSKLNINHEESFQQYVDSNLEQCSIRLKKYMLKNYFLNKINHITMDLVFKKYALEISNYLIKEYLNHKVIQKKKIDLQIF